MGKYRPLRTKCWIKFLEAHGYRLDRISASHHQYIKKGFRTIAVWGNEKDIPAMHVKTSCSSGGFDIDYVLRWIEENC